MEPSMGRAKRAGLPLRASPAPKTRLRSVSPELPNASSTDMHPLASANRARMAVSSHRFGTLRALPGSRPAWARPRRKPSSDAGRGEHRREPEHTYGRVRYETVAQFDLTTRSFPRQTFREECTQSSWMNTHQLPRGSNMVSPFVRRQRLATVLRDLREERGMMADELAKRIHYSRTKIS